MLVHQRVGHPIWRRLQVLVPPGLSCIFWSWMPILLGEDTLYMCVCWNFKQGKQPLPVGGWEHHFPHIPPGIWWWGPLRASWLKQPVPREMFFRAKIWRATWKSLFFFDDLWSFRNHFHVIICYLMNIVANTPYKCINLHMSSYVLMLEIGLEMFFNVIVVVQCPYSGGWNSFVSMLQLGHLSVGHAPSEAGWNPWNINIPWIQAVRWLNHCRTSTLKNCLVVWNHGILWLSIYWE